MEISKMEHVSATLRALMFFLLISLCTQTQAVAIYSHGYGERGPRDTHYSVEGFDNPDAQGPIYTDSASFYTRPAVIKLLDYIHEQVIVQGHNTVKLMGRSCGAGIIINALAKLIDYDNQQLYFNGSAIASKDEACAILNAINSGEIELVCPLLSLEKTVLIKKTSKVAAVCSLSWLLGKTCFAKARNACAKFLDTIIAPSMFHDYDANHDKPIDLLPIIAGNLKCPILIQVCKNDGVVANSSDDIALLYAALRKGNEQHTYIFVSTDAWHNSISPSYLIFKKQADKGAPLSECELRNKLSNR